MSPALITWDRNVGGENGFGFEGGNAIQLAGMLHWFTTELVAPPNWWHTKIAHWTSADGVQWSRRATIVEGSSNASGGDPRATVWAPIPIFDDTRNRWTIFYVGYHSDAKRETGAAYDGRIFRAVAQNEGMSGIGGPYDTEDVVMQPDMQSQPWEGLQGVDSFFPFRRPGSEEGWLALYGSATIEHLARNPSATRWRVGMAHAPELSGPWKRATSNPIDAEPVFIENPVIVGRYEGNYLAMYENDAISNQHRRCFGLMSTEDGINWRRQPMISLEESQAPWISRIRTPVGAIQLTPSTFRVFFTAYDLYGQSVGGPSRGSLGSMDVHFTASSPA